MEPVKIEPSDVVMPDGTPLKNISLYSSADVLCGRSSRANYHAGNNHWRALVAANKHIYIRLSKKQKILVSKSIVNAIRIQTPRGRFLQKNHETDLWNDIGDLKATKKTSRALRDGELHSQMVMEKDQQNRGAPVDLVRDPMAWNGYPRPGQILPNGLIALDFNFSAQQNMGREFVHDRAINVCHPVLTASMILVAPSAKRMDPMMKAYQRSMSAKSGQQVGMVPHLCQPAQQQPTPSSDSALVFVRSLNSSRDGNSASMTSAVTKQGRKASESPQYSSNQSPKANCPKLPLHVRSVDYVETTQGQTESSLAIFGQENILLYNRSGDIFKAQTQLPKSTHLNTSTDTLAPGMSNERALQIPREHAQKAQNTQDNAAEAKPNTLYRIQSAANTQLKTLHNLRPLIAERRDHIELTGLPRRSSSSLLDSPSRDDTNDVPAFLPTLGNVGSMSDEDIQEIPHTLKKSQLMSPPTTTSAVASFDQYSPEGLMRNLSPSRIISAGGWPCSSVDPLGSLQPLEYQAAVDKAAGQQYAHAISRSDSRPNGQLSSLSRKMKTFQRLMDSGGSPMYNSPRIRWAKWENAEETWVSPQKSTAGVLFDIDIKSGKNNQSLMVSLDEKVKAANAVLVLQQLKRGVRHSPQDYDEREPPSRRQAMTNMNSDGKGPPANCTYGKAAPEKLQEWQTDVVSHDNVPNVPQRDVSLTKGAIHGGVTQDLHAPPITEVTIERRHSFAMPKISPGRSLGDHGQSALGRILQGGGSFDEGQFDDAIEE